MAKYLSHLSAAAYWNIPYIGSVLGSEIADTELVDFTVTECSERFQRKGCRIHFCKIDLPRNAIVRRDGKMVASPELVFLQLASRLSIHKLILLGLQLCSSPPGQHTDAITTKKKIKSLLAQSSGHLGQAKALRAIKHVKDGSASVMESIVYMMLTLPHALGGYGIKGPAFNVEINLKEDAAMRLRQQRCFIDLYYSPAKLAIEYDSFAFHNSPSQQGKDSIRSGILSRQGIDVLHLSTIQIYDPKACTDFAVNLASHLGKRIEIRTEKFEKMHILLRLLLPSANVQTP
ncbi:MAG: hypothetical protein EOM51_11375 [Clostridia bacterium]|nr:hypothetical protein [Clostridia bacterium]